MAALESSLTNADKVKPGSMESDFHERLKADTPDVAFSPCTQQILNLFDVGVMFAREN